jgi:hypothetical protein
MTTEAMTFSRRIRKLDTGYKTFTKPSYLHRFRYSIERSDWDEEVLIQEEWVEKMCIGVITIASLFIVSVLVMMFLR